MKKKPDCTMCDDTGYKDHGSPFRMEPCDHKWPPPLPELLPCPNPACRSTDVRYRSSLKGGQYIVCLGCSLSISDGGQDHLYATWNSLPRIVDGTPRAWIYVSRFGDAELIFNRNTEYATRLREQGYSEDPLYLGALASPADCFSTEEAQE